MLPIKGLDCRSMVKIESVHILFLLEIVLFSRVFMNSRFDLNIFYFIYKIYLQKVWTVWLFFKKNYLQWADPVECWSSTPSASSSSSSSLSSPSKDSSHPHHSRDAVRLCSHCKYKLIKNLPVKKNMQFDWIEHEVIFTIVYYTQFDLWEHW